MLKEIQSSYNISVRKPPVGAETRWGSFVSMARWVNENKVVLIDYDAMHPKDCAMLEDGSAYPDHALSGEDWDVLAQLVSVWFCYVPKNGLDCIKLIKFIDLI